VPVPAPPGEQQSADAILKLVYQLLETLRQYGQERLAESGEADALRDRHFAY
jgi:predicted ATPase